VSVPEKFWGFYVSRYITAEVYKDEVHLKTCVDINPTNLLFWKKF
jgi:hypothetical protein